MSKVGKSGSHIRVKEGNIEYEYGWYTPYTRINTELLSRLKGS
jgi:hypothetical protein